MWHSEQRAHVSLQVFCKLLQYVPAAVIPFLFLLESNSILFLKWTCSKTSSFLVSSPVNLLCLFASCSSTLFLIGMLFVLCWMDMWFEIFSPSHLLSFHSLLSAFFRMDILILMKSTSLFFYGSILLVLSLRILCLPQSCEIFLYFLLKVTLFFVLHLQLYHFELIFRDVRVGWGSFSCKCPAIPTPMRKDSPFSIYFILPLFQKAISHVCMGLFLASVHQSIPLSKSHCYNS